MTRRRQPPRLLLKTLAVTYVTVAVLLGAVFVVVTVSVRDQVRDAVADNLESTQRLFAELEERRQRELFGYAATLAESPTLKAALDTYTVESALGTGADLESLVSTVARELDKLAAQVDADAAVVVDVRQRPVAAAGTLARYWTDLERMSLNATERRAGGYDGTAEVGGETFRVLGVPLFLRDTSIGTLYLATRIDRAHVDMLSDLSRAHITVIRGNRLHVTTLPPTLAAEFVASLSAGAGGGGPVEGTASLGEETYAYRRLVRLEDTQFYALGSIDESAQSVTGQITRRLFGIVFGAAIIAFAGSLFLARLVTDPINRLSASIAELVDLRTADQRLSTTGSSLEVDRLAESFNTVLASVSKAEAETQAVYTGAIRALAASLDARDAYTAGHSERVSVLSTAIGRELNLPPDQLEILRLGALLHDIGKIGVPDEILLKPGRLTESEFEVIKTHPAVGERILRTVPFLTPHLPIVELHHERPDGKGYPRGLRGDEIPLLARIVHVADAYDAMTSARAYRDALPTAAVLQELWQYAGTQFHAEIVAALAVVLPTTRLAPRDAPQPVPAPDGRFVHSLPEGLEAQARG